MKSEFKLFGLEKAGTLTAVLELLGAVGLLVGLKIQLILLISAGGLAILMFLGVAVRVKVKDSLWISLPALFFMILNFYIFYMSLPVNKQSGRAITKVLSSTMDKIKFCSNNKTTHFLQKQ